MSIPRIIHQCHVGCPLPEDMKNFVDTPILHNPTWRRIFWTEDNIHELGLSYAEMLKQYQAPVHVAEVVRLVAVQKLGGIYLDCDMEVIRPLDSLLEHKAFAAIQDGSGQVCNAAFGAEPYHPWIDWQLANIMHYYVKDQPWSVRLMTQAPRRGVTLVPTDTFYPWTWETPKADRKWTENTLAIHHWKGSWAPWVVRDRT